jgi:hypothetical protein
LSEIQTKLCLAWFIARDTVPHTTAHRYNTWSLEPVPFLFTKEFSDFLGKAGATQSVEGLQIAIGRADRSFVPLSTQSVPEPSSILGLLMVVLVAGFLNFYVLNKTTDFLLNHLTRLLDKNKKSTNCAKDSSFC